MRRRLPLLAPPDVHEGDPAQPWGARAPLPRTVGLADTGDGEEALAFARDLAAALAARGLRPHLALTALGRAPALTAPAREALEAVTSGVSLHGIAADAPASGLALPAGPALVVGVPALACFAPALAVLLGVQRAPARWPAALRSVRDEAHLALAAPRPALPKVLAATLAADGFLLR